MSSVEIVRENMPWREVYREVVEKFTEQGLILKGLRIRECLTQKELSEMVGVKPYQISEIERGKRHIDIRTARKLAKALRSHYTIFSTT